METTIHLQKDAFSPFERILVEHGGMTASSFLYPTGVHALRIRNRRGEMVLLPFQGQQIWSARFDGRELTMRSMFTQPRATRTYLENYGGFLLHCGFTAMGVPTAGDSHPLHGELPNAPYDNAQLYLGEDEAGAYIRLGGSYQHTVAFNYNYLAQPSVTLHDDTALIQVAIAFTNLKNTPMEYMYLAHANFRPVDHARLVYSAKASPATVRVRRSIPSHIHPQPGYREFLEELASNPGLHHNLAPGLLFDPEVVFYIDFKTDSAGWAHCLQVHPDGSADYIRHKPAQLPKGVRWICRTPDQDALGLLLPATAEPEGYSAEKAKGNLKTLGPKERIEFTYELGSLSPAETAEKAALIDRILAGG